MASARVFCGFPPFFDPSMLQESILIGFYFLTLLYSVIVHEVSHGVMALWLGDTTARYADRLNLNPIKHIDPFGSILLPALLIMTTGSAFGWAKPVPYNPYNLKDQKWGPLWVALAGPGSNLLAATVAGVVAHMSPLYRDWETDRKSTRLNSSHRSLSRMPSSA